MTVNHPGVVRFARRSTRGLLLGLSAPRVAVLAAAAFVAVTSTFLTGAIGLILSALVWLPLGATAAVRVAGRAAVEWVGTATHFTLRRATTQTDYRARPNQPRPTGTLALPGDAAALRLHHDEPTGAAMIHDPHRRTLTAVLSVTHPAFALLDNAERAGRVGRWGRTLAQLANTGTVADLQVLERTVPDPATGQHQWWAERGDHTAGWPATQYQALLDQVRLDAATHQTTVSLSLDLRATQRAARAAGGGLTGAASVLRADMANLTDALRQAGLHPGAWLDSTGIAAILRLAYDPAATDLSDADLFAAGPMAVSESWDRLRHDTGWSQVLWVAEWPRVAVPTDFLHPLVFTPGVRRSLSLHALPLPTDRALRDIRRDKTSAVADSAQKARVGQIADLADDQEYEDLLARERSIIAGHTDVAFTGLITVTADTSEQLDAATAAVTRAAGQSCCELRPVYGRQLQAFAASALPLARTPL